MRKLQYGAAVAACLSLAAPALARVVDSPLIGLWQLDSYTVEDAAKQVVQPLGDHPGGYIVYTNGGHIMLVFVGNNRKPPAGAVLSNADAGQYLTSMVALAGTYQPAGKGKFTVHVEDSWNQSLTGTDVPRNFKIVGKQLTVTFTAKNPANGQEVQVTATSHRVE